MHLDEAESDLLKKWIIKKLEDISDADSDVLADYVLALVKTDDPEAKAKTNCVENLKDFLLSNAEPFVNGLFQAIATKSYDPSRPPPKPSAPVYQPSRRSSLEPPRLPNESRKRSYHDWDRDEDSNVNGRIQSYHGDDRPVKQLRRGGRGFEQRGGRHTQTHFQPHGFSSQQLPAMPAFDPNNPFGQILAMQQAMGMLPGMPNAGSPTNGYAFAAPQPRQRCRDYDTKGFCTAGASCPHEHGNETFVVPGFNQEYDPNHATLLNITPSRVGQVSFAQNDEGRGPKVRGRGRGRGGSNWRGGGKRSDFSQMGPNRDTSITSIVVEQIPDDKYDEQVIREFFSGFGNIDEVELQPQWKLAIVKYDSYDAAKAAYESPSVVFDNRFVKVYWYKPERFSKTSDLPFKPVGATSKDQDVEMADGSHVDPDEILKRQEEAQRKHDGAKKQREEAAKQKEDVDFKLKKMEAERQRMAELLAKKAGTASSPGTESPTTNGAAESEQTKALKAQLAKLEAEAKSLGIDPDATTNGFSPHTTYRGRGSYRGRGRGRGRGYYAGYRGGWPGAGGRGGAVMRLDNRPRTVAVTFSDGSYENRDEALRQSLLFNSLDSASISKHPDRDDTALIAFNQRYEGENFMAAAGGSELLHIGKVELSWYKAGDQPITVNGNHDTDDSKMVITETSDQPSSEARAEEVYENGDGDDLDRW